MAILEAAELGPSRRAFLGTAALTGVALCAEAQGAVRRGREKLPLPDIPNFCAHEHWGSFDAIGSSPEGFRADVEAGAEPRRRVTLLDLVLDPYLGGMLGGAGFKLQEALKQAGLEGVFEAWRTDPERVFALLRPALEEQRLTGVFQCTSRGIALLHHADLRSFKLDDWLRADAAIGAAYTRIFDWYEQGMAAAQFDGLVRPMQPEFYFNDCESPAARHELAFTRTVLRIDPFLHFWKQDYPRREALAAKAGIAPENADSWRAFLHTIFDQAQQRGALGIKQLQAYSRALDYPVQEDTAVMWHGDLNPDQVRVFQNWVVNACCVEAQQRGWLHQVHVGTHNLDDSSPLPLEALARRYPAMPIVMIHCWPFLREAGWLAKYVPNIHIDTCWQPVLNPQFLAESLDEWMNYVPLHKIMLSHDSTSLEMAAGSALFTREILREALQRQRTQGISGRAARAGIAEELLHGNAVRLYGSA